MKRLFAALLAVLCILFSACSPTAETTSGGSLQNEAAVGASLDNATKGWGFRRMDPRPEFTAEQTAEMAAYGCYYMGAEDNSLYLTFDEGYENGYTGQILDVLKEKNVPAAFFVTGPYLKTETELVARMVNEGHIVGNHSVNHPSLPDLSVEEIEKELYDLDLMFYEKYAAHMTYLRPPRGEYSTRVLDITNKMGYTSVFWSVAYVDWKTDAQQGKQHALDSVLPQLHGGAVILLHAVSSDNAAAMAELIDCARAKGYEFRSLNEYH